MSFFHVITDVPPDRRVTIELPESVPIGPVTLEIRIPCVETYFEVRLEESAIARRYHIDEKTGERVPIERIPHYREVRSVGEDT